MNTVKPTLDAEADQCAANATHLLLATKTDDVCLELNPGLKIAWRLGWAGGVLPSGADIGEVIIER